MHKAVELRRLPEGTAGGAEDAAGIMRQACYAPQALLLPSRSSHQNRAGVLALSAALAAAT